MVGHAVYLGCPGREFRPDTQVASELETAGPGRRGQQGQGHHTGGADLLARPPGFKGVDGHSLSSSGVG